MTKKLLQLLCLLFIGNCYSQKDVTIPQEGSFGSESNSQSSVNQSNGKLGVSLNLISLKGYKDLNASFSIGYDGAGITKVAKASNEMVPSGIMGIGWGMSFSKIVADNKRTASRDDDTYYLLDGSLNKLIGTEKNGSVIHFKSKQYNPWKISFDTSTETWAVIKENGYKYIYSNVDWAIYWDNWIGDSNQSGASRQGTAWNLTSIEDMYGNKVQYEYLNVEQSLTNTGSIKHTEATYLSKIIGPCGEEIRLIYNNKSYSEYYEPNTKDPQEPDAYQEKYEKKYLKWAEAYDTNQNLLYKYSFDYQLTGSGEFRKRFLTNITLYNADNESQLFRKFEYDTNASSDFYGNLLHQILPTQGRVSYQYGINEIEVDQITDDIGSPNLNYIVQGNYIIERGGGKIHTWNGTSWEQQALNFGTGDIQLIYKENFIVALWKHSSSLYKSSAYRLKDDGYTWQSSNSQSHHTSEPLRLIAGNDFYAIGNQNRNQIKITKWNDPYWNTEVIESIQQGKYFYTATNNYIIQNRRVNGHDKLKFFYFDITGELNIVNRNLDFTSSGSACATDWDDCPNNYWYAQNSFAQVNANGNPEYFLRWNKNYTQFYLDNSTFGALTDDLVSYPIANDYFMVADWNTGSLYGVKTARYLGNGNWSPSSLNIPHVGATSYENKISRIGLSANTVFGPIAPDGFSYQTAINYFNANTGGWLNYSNGNQYSRGANNSKLCYSAFGRNLLFAYDGIFKLNNNLSINELNYNVPANTVFSKSDGGNLLYYSSRNESISSGSAFAKIITYNSKNQLFEYNLPSGFYLKKNPLDDYYPKHAIGGGAFVLENADNNQIKFYKLIDNEIQVNTQGKTIQKDIVIVKETFDPVLSRKQSNYYCYSNPKISNDNSRVYYSQVSQQNDLEGRLGKTVTFYDVGLEDVRRTGLPNKIQIFDGDKKMISEQTNYWRVRQMGASFYINLDKKTNRTIEKGQEYTVAQTYTYDFETGLVKKTMMTDSEGNLETTSNYYLFEEYPAIKDTYNLLNPIIYTRTYMNTTSNPKSATAVKWDVTGIPYPKRSYSWKGTGTTVFNFSGANPTFRLSKYLSQYDSLGNLIEEKGRTSVTTSYVYGYDHKRLVAKIEGATYNQAIALVNTNVIDNPTSDAVMRAELQKIRDGLPDAFVTSYTYEPSIGVTSATDARGVDQFYEYDAFYRLDHIKDTDGKILKQNMYQYRETPFAYEPLSTALPDCDLINTDINTDPNNVDPLTLSVSPLGTPSNEIAVFKAIASDGGNYTINWLYEFTDTVNPLDFLVLTNGNRITIANHYCNEGGITVRAEITGYNPTTQQVETIASNSVSHIFSSSNCTER